MNKNYTSQDSGSPAMAAEPAVAYTVRHRPAFGPYQMQILDSIARVHDEREMQDIRNLIAEYFSNKALDAMDQLCDEGKLSTQDIESWQTEHMHTPYNY